MRISVHLKLEIKSNAGILVYNLIKVSTSKTFQEEPQMVGRIRKALRANALSFMNSQLQAAVKELGLLPDNVSNRGGMNGESNGDENSKPAALKEFIEETRERFMTALDRHLLLGDQVSR